MLATSTGVAQPAHGDKVYRWTDSKGVIHYGDQVPPKYAGQDHIVLNDHGVPVGFHQGTLSESEKAAREKKQQAAAAAKKAQQKQATRDKVLLETYLSVDDIKKLRDRRLASLDSQIRVTKQYIAGLKETLAQLKSEASAYSKPSHGRSPRKVPASLRQEIDNTEDTINSYKAMLSGTRARQAKVRTTFKQDIARFRELKASATNSAQH